jgi:hypothetical protein
MRNPQRTWTHDAATHAGPTWHRVWASGDNAAMWLRSLFRRLRVFERRWIPDSGERNTHQAVVRARLGGADPAAGVKEPQQAGPDSPPEPDDPSPPAG